MPEKSSHPRKQPPGKTRRWRRSAAAALLLLAGGAVVNAAVAWGAISYEGKFARAGLRAGTAVSLTEPLIRRDQKWLERAGWRDVPLGANREYQPALFATRGAFGFEWRSFYIFESQSIETGRGEHILGGPMDLYCLRAGWPFIAFEGGIRRRGLRASNLNARVQTDFDPISLIPFDVSPWSNAFGLPLRPLSPGFAINTLLYALLLWLLFFAPFTARRMLRRRRALCEKCAYPIGVSPVCTECGAAVTRKDAT
jgi:hypothetical protein